MEGQPYVTVRIDLDYEGDDEEDPDTQRGPGGKIFRRGPVIHGLGSGEGDHLVMFS
ncbi:MAG: hypothetical protein UHD09_03115 [Bifidobacterium sp.]|nr:hypothetical protein [Bifidobacterium sp.]